MMFSASVQSFLQAGKSLPFRSMTVFNFLLEATLAGSILIVVVLILRRVFRKQIGSRLVYLAWALVAVRLLVPLALPNPLMDEFRPTYSLDVEARPVADQFRVRYQDALSDASNYLYTQAVEHDSPVLRDMSSLALQIGAYTSYGWLGKVYLLLWLAGALTVLGVFSARHIRFRRKLLRDSVGPLEGEQLALYQSLCDRLKVKRLPVLYVDPLPSPCLVGVLRPIIAMPLTLPPDALAEALTHELCHYRAKDPWWVLVRCVCCAVHWFNPLVWIAQRFVKTDCELACDARVTARLPETERLHYANTLVNTAKVAYAPKAGVLSTGLTMTGKRLKERINAILHMRAVRKVAASITAVVLVLLTVLAFSTAESITQSDLFRTDQSAFPFIENEAYPVPDNYWGDPVPLKRLANATNAAEQAKAYLNAIFSYGFGNDIADCRYEAHLYDVWLVAVYPAEGGELLYSMELDGDGRLSYLVDNASYPNDDYTVNVTSVLPRNLNEVLRIYGQRMARTLFEGLEVDTCTISTDYDYPTGRVLYGTLTNSQDDSVRVHFSAQIAPELKILSVSNGSDVAATAPVTLDAASSALVYGKDPTVAFSAVDWGQTDSQYAVPATAKLTVQQAFDLAAEAMLNRPDVTPEAFAGMYLRYGYYDAIYTEAEISDWYFDWYLTEDMQPEERYYVTVQDLPENPSVYISAPGEGLG